MTSLTTGEVSESKTQAETRDAKLRRWVILTLLVSIIVINFIDRQTLSMLAPVLRNVFHLSNTAYERIVAALS